jgi:hypothetical protein
MVYTTQSIWIVFLRTCHTLYRHLIFPNKYISSTPTAIFLCIWAVGRMGYVKTIGKLTVSKNYT